MSDQALSNIPGITCEPSKGALYCFPNIKTLIQKNHCQTDVNFAEKLLDQTGIIVVPGSAFGSTNFIRISYTLDTTTLKKAIQLFCSLA